jgi:peptidyl-prolyl cis-trans isomerase D
MLEAIRERSQGWIAKVILGMLIIPFALWGLDSYMSTGGKEAPVAKIGDDEISQREFVKTLKEQKEQLGGKVDEKALRKQVLDQLVNTRLLTQAAHKAGFSILDPQVQSVLAGVEIFQESGKFSEARLDAWLKNRGMSRAELLSMIGQDLLLKQVQIGYGEGAVFALPSATRLANLLAQQREVNEVVFDGKSFASSPQIAEATSDKAVEAEYKAHQADFTTPDMIRVQYLTLSQAALASAVQVSEAQARKFFDENPAQFQEPEQRRASHILIKVEANATAAAKQAAKARAEQLLAEVRKTPAKFAELARQHSQDPGSGEKGGDLGTFSRDMMVKPFADAAWAMKPGEIQGLVESQFGYHIIRLDGVIGGAKMGFAVVKDEIIQSIKQQESAKRFVEAAERFSNMVYEQPESLEPAAKEFGLKIEESGWIGKGQAQPAMLGDSRLIEALLSEDALKKKQNVEAIEVAPNTLVSARVIEHRPAGVRALADVASEIRARLAAATARKLAAEAGKKALESARAGQVPANLSAPMTVSRMRPLNVPSASVRALFAANVSTLPAYVGVDSAEGYRLYRINRVDAVTPPAEQVKAMRNDMRRLLAQEEMRAYLESIKSRAKIKIEPSALEPKAE